MEEVRSAVGEHMELMADLVQKLSSELRSGLRPAYNNFIGFFHAIDWKEPWLICLLAFHAVLLIITIFSRKNTNFQMCLFLLALVGVYLAETLNKFLGDNWKRFATQNYFDPSGLFLSVLWSGPLLAIAIIILINTLFTMCFLIVRWKKAELRHRARLSRNKQD
ncbi:transmembrane protein 18 [Herrania umbratica]|uniref:Transmembrane protein 18 n=1 Tax=Herrania umbratica TaxID=108875 RepID=A0A6J1BLX5_9ROSI|nr:transmembrane protein 18 [Herrania umbratica]